MILAIPPDNLPVEPESASNLLAAFRRPAPRWGAFKLTPDHLASFRCALEPYAEEGRAWTDEEVAEMAYVLVHAVAVVARLSARR